MNLTNLEIGQTFELGSKTYTLESFSTRTGPNDAFVLLQLKLKDAEAGVEGVDLLDSAKGPFIRPDAPAVHGVALFDGPDIPNGYRSLVENEKMEVGDLWYHAGHWRFLGKMSGGHGTKWNKWDTVPVCRKDGFRLLEDGELINKDDQVHNCGLKWERTSLREAQFNPMSHHPHRRKL